MGPKAKQSLIQLLAPLSKGNVSKSSLSTVSDIYNKVSSRTDLDNLLEINYLGRVLWKYFHADVTNNHIELILALVFHDSLVRGSKSAWDTISENRSKLNDLLSRVLQTTMTTTLDTQASCFEYLSYLFLSCVLRYDPEALLRHEAFTRWLDQVLNKYTNCFLDSSYSAENIKTACALVYFLRVSYVEGIRVVNDAVSSRCFLSVFTTCDDPQLQELIRKQTPTPSIEAFTRLQRQAKELGVESLAFCLSPYDLDRSDLQENLAELDTTQLKQLAFMYSGELFNHDFLADAIIRTCIPQMERAGINELDLFDNLNQSPILSVSVPAVLDTSDIVSNWKSKACAEINTHLTQCLRRLNISKEGVQGASKYFTEVEKLEGSGLQVDLQLKTKRDDIKPGHFVVLVSIEEPQKFDECLRKSKYGITKAQLVEVAATAPKCISVKLQSEFRSINGVFTLPSENVAALLSLLEDKGALKRLASHDNQDHASKKTKDSSHSAASETNIEKELWQVFENTKSSTVSFVQCLPHAEVKSLINMILDESLQTATNFDPKDRTLLIMPSVAHIASLNLDSNLNHLIYHAGSTAYTKKVVQGLFEHVNDIAKSLELQEFDFTSSLRNALALYELHVEPRWGEFLKNLNQKQNAVSTYPFKSVELKDKDKKSLSQALKEIASHYASISKTFSQIQRLLPLDKADLEHHADEVDRVLSRNFPFVVCSPDSLHLVGRDYAKIISFVGAETEAAMGTSTKQVIFFGSSSPIPLDSVLQLERRPLVRPEVAALISENGDASPGAYNPGVKHSCQWIRVPSSEEQVNVNEATYLVSFYQFLRLLGYRLEDISLVVTSPYMKLLAEEILEDQKIIKNSEPDDSADSFQFGWPLLQLASVPIVPAKYVLFSTHGDLSFKDAKAAITSAALGFYAFGGQSLPFPLKAGPLQVYTGANVVAGTDDREQGHKAHTIENAQHMAEYISEMLAIRRRK